MKKLTLGWIAILFVSLCIGRAAPPPTSTNEVLSLDVTDDPRTSQPKFKEVHKRARGKKAYATRVRYVKVAGRWSGQVQLPLAAGDVLTPAKLFTAMEALEDLITTNS